MTSVAYFQVDAFATETGKGNPAAVCFPTISAELFGTADTLSAADTLSVAGEDCLSVPSDDWMQQVAADFGHPETAFVYPDKGELRLRWFTPKVEVDLCGHATLAAVHVIRELHQAAELPNALASFWKQGSIQFVSRSGVLSAESAADGITLDFPATPIEPFEMTTELEAALNIPAGRFVACGRSQFDLFIRLPAASDVRKLSPDMNQLSAIPVRGIIVTALGDMADHDFISRFFAPACGIPEDSVTGSAHCALATYWAPEFGRNVLFGYQASPRGGHVRMDLRGDRVRLSGQAITNERGVLQRG